MKDYLELVVILLFVIALTKPLGLYLSQVLNPKSKTFLDSLLKPLEKKLYRFFKINPAVEQNWTEYLTAILVFSFLCILVTSLGLVLQTYLPLNPQNLGPLSLDLNLNTSISFVTNTNWQSYAGESTLSYFSQMGPLTLQNFISPSVGLCVAACIVRGLSRSSSKTLGNFWIDLTRIILYIMIPIAVTIALLLLIGGCPQNFDPYTSITTLEGGTQSIVQGPIASQEAIKMLGTNGGGYTNVNSAHPFENPSSLTNIIQIIVMLLIPSAQLYYLGLETKNKKHGWTLFVAMLVLFIAGFSFFHHFETKGNPNFKTYGLASLKNLEGKETRFGIGASTLFATTTTATSTGAVNCNHDSLTPLGGLIPFINMQLGEVIFGGVGSGLYGSIVFVILAIFIAGLIIGRTPEYLGKKIDAFDIKAAVFATIPFLISILALTAWSSLCVWSKEALGNSGPHGFSEILYAFTSTTANNGSAFAGLSTNTPMWNSILSLAMLIGRIVIFIPIMALAGSMASKKKLNLGLASFPITGFTFGILFIGVILLVGLLTFLPSLIMGPFIEQFFMNSSKLYPLL